MIYVLNNEYVCRDSIALNAQHNEDTIFCHSFQKIALISQKRDNYDDLG